MFSKKDTFFVPDSPFGNFNDEKTSIVKEHYLNRSWKKERVTDFLTGLKTYLEENWSWIIEEAASVTGVPIKYHYNDVKSCIKYLSHIACDYRYLNSLNHYKPYKNSLVILSSNEPIKMSIIPLITGIFSGTFLFIRVSKKVFDFQVKILNFMIESLGANNLFIFPSDVNICSSLLKEGTFQNCISYSSNKTAKAIYSDVNMYTRYLFESEGNDTVIVDENRFNIDDVAKSIVEASIYHQGQMCNCIKEIYIKESLFEDYKVAIIKYINKIIIGDIHDFSSQLSDQIYTKENVLSKILFDYQEFSPYIKLFSYGSNNDILRSLNSDYNKNLSLHILSESQNFVDDIIGNTVFSRYCINKISFHKVGIKEKWGGVGKSGNSGPIKWEDRYRYLKNIL